METWNNTDCRCVPWQEVKSCPCPAPAEDLPGQSESVARQRLSLSSKGPQFLHRKCWISSVERFPRTVRSSACRMWFVVSWSGYSLHHRHELMPLTCSVSIDDDMWHLSQVCNHVESWALPKLALKISWKKWISGRCDFAKVIWPITTHNLRKSRNPICDDYGPTGASQFFWICADVAAVFAKIANLRKNSSR